VIIDYTTRAVAALDTMTADRASEVRRGIEKLKDKPYHPVSYAMNDAGNLRKAMVREGVMVEYAIFEELILIVVLEIFDVTGYLDEE
jgi:endonuclease YncB( thermonuclease family)